MSKLLFYYPATVLICKYARARDSTICSTYEIQPSFGYCAWQKSKYFGYKFHGVCDKNALFHCFDLTPAHVHISKRRYGTKANSEHS